MLCLDRSRLGRMSKGLCDSPLKINKARRSGAV
jgi:hypothetical protein